MFDLNYLIISVILASIPVPLFICIRTLTENLDFVLVYLWAEHYFIGKLIGFYPDKFDHSNGGGFFSFPTHRGIFVLTVVIDCAILALFFYLILSIIGRLLA